MRELILSDGSKAQVSDWDYEYCTAYNWRPSSMGYPVASINGKDTFLHKFIGNELMGLVGKIDHKDRNRRNCQDDNLRTATQQDNMKNKSKYRNNKTGIPGVIFSKGKYWATITVDKKVINLGSAFSLEAAKNMRELAEEEHFGKFRDS